MRGAGGRLSERLVGGVMVVLKDWPCVDCWSVKYCLLCVCQVRILVIRSWGSLMGLA